ncbi:MAG: acyl carrier protein [Myxococcales bacterium]|nr:acyl carrier protein [Myxococcales bacterium]
MVEQEIERGATEAEHAAAALAEIQRIVCEELAIPRRVEPTDELVRDLGLDSVSWVTLIVFLEQRFGVALPEEETAVLVTVDDLTTLVVRRTTSEVRS